MGISAARRSAGHWDDLSTLAAELDAVIAALVAAGQLPRRRMPTHSQLRAAGRGDLRYGLQRHGHSALAAALGLAPNRAGRATSASVLAAVAAASAAAPVGAHVLPSQSRPRAAVALARAAKSHSNGIFC